MESSDEEVLELNLDDDEDTVHEPVAAALVNAIASAQGSDSSAETNRVSVEDTAAVAALVSMLRQHKGDSSGVDGAKTTNTGPCECGYKHWCGGVEFDYVFAFTNELGTATYLGYNAGDNAYTVAEAFVLENNIAKGTLNHQALISQVANRIMEASASSYVPNIDQKPSDWDATKAEFHQSTGAARYNKATGKYEGTMYYNDKKLAEQNRMEKKLRDSAAKSNQEKVEEEIRLKEIERRRVAETIERDKAEKEASRKYKEALLPAAPAGVKSAYNSNKKRMIGQDGSVTFVEDKTSSQSKRGGIQDISHDTDPGDNTRKLYEQALGLSGSGDDEEDAFAGYNGLPPKDEWTIKMFLQKLEQDGKEKTILDLMKVGFSISEISQYIVYSGELRRQQMKADRDNIIRALGLTAKNSKLHSRAPKKPEQFAGTGYTLNETSPSITPLTSPSPSPSPSLTTSPRISEAESFVLKVDESLPTTTIRVRLLNGSQTRIKVNLSHTVSELVSHIRTLCELTCGEPLKLQLSYPRKVIAESQETIEAAGLKGCVLTLVRG